jgi:hypothetical protein
MGTPNELTGAVVLLSSMQATYINGMMSKERTPFYTSPQILSKNVDCNRSRN